jgi:hypothetical protein
VKSISFRRASVTLTPAGMSPSSGRASGSPGPSGHTRELRRSLWRQAKLRAPPLEAGPRRGLGEPFGILVGGREHTNRPFVRISAKSAPETRGGAAVVIAPRGQRPPGGDLAAQRRSHRSSASSRPSSSSFSRSSSRLFGLGFHLGEKRGRGHPLGALVGLDVLEAALHREPRRAFAGLASMRGALADHGPPSDQDGTRHLGRGQRVRRAGMHLHERTASPAGPP